MAPIASLRLVRWFCGLVLTLLAGTVGAQDLVSALREEVVSVRKAGLFDIELETTYFRPPGDGPFPLIIINHGKAMGNPKLDPRARFLVAARELVQRGFAVVVPMRQGFSKSGGSYVGVGCNVHSNGLTQAEDVQVTLQSYAARPELDTRRVVVIGQSHGGLTTLALGALRLPQVVGLINFAGGLRQDQCTNWEAGLAEAFGRYGRETRIPALFFYGDNDSYFSVSTWQAMVQAYRDSGADVELVAFGTFGSDAHSLFSSRAGVKIWWPAVEGFLRKLGLPTEKRFDIRLVEHDVAVPPPSGFAELSNAQALPGVGSAAREGYRAYLAADAPKAFAISAQGAWQWRSGVADAIRSTLQRCAERNQGKNCKLYAVDDHVVWTRE